MGLVVVKNNLNPVEAALCESLLDDAEIPYQLLDKEIAHFYTVAVGGIKVVVPEEFSKEAHDLLKGVNDGEVSGGAKENRECPNCGSPEVLVKRNGRLSIFFFFLLGLIAKPRAGDKCKCISCGNTWQGSC